MTTRTGGPGQPRAIPEWEVGRRPSDLPLSYAQQRLWFLEQYHGSDAGYHIKVAYRLHGQLDKSALTRSIRALVARHESLRTRFELRDGKPLQRVEADMPVSVAFLKAPDQSRLADRMREAVRQPFDLSTGPLLRVHLYELASDEHVFLLVLHHIVSDGWSMGVFYRELSVLYESECAGRQGLLPPLPMQYADYALWQRARLTGDVLERELAYWLNQLDGVPEVLELPMDRPRRTVRRGRGGEVRKALPASLMAQLQQLSRARGCTLFMTLLAVFQVLLYRYTGREDIVVGTPMAGRNRADLEGLIGFLVNTLVLRGDLSGSPSFEQLLDRIRRMTLEAYTHHELPFERLVEALNPSRGAAYSPVVQVMFVLQNAPTDRLTLGPLSVSPVALSTGTSKFDLLLSVSESDSGLSVRLEYDADLFDEATIERMSEHYRRLLESVTLDALCPIWRLPMVGGRERHRLLTEWNDTRTRYPRNETVHGLFEAQAAQTPDAVALVCEAGRLSYGELNRRSTLLAHYLRNLGVGPEVLVGVCVERSFELVIGQLAILKAGGAYVPLDPDYPRARLDYMLQDTSAPVLLLQGRFGELFSGGTATGVDLDTFDWSRSPPETALDSGCDAGNLVYVMYTSGSTGVPKGVMIPHRGVVRLTQSADYVRLGPEQTILHMAPSSFDASTFELWGALLNGGRCVLHPAGVPDIGSLQTSIAAHGVTTLWLTASFFNLVVTEAPEALAGVSQLLIGGEALSTAHVRRARSALPDARIVNGYGPTEGTTFSCCYPIPTVLSGTCRSVPIGRPIANTCAHVLDPHLDLLPVGVTGELYLGGDGLARGYLNRPELTAERFVADPFDPDPGARLYRTGDLVRRLGDGNLEFLGRMDQQVKLSGFRIEPGEIESVLGQHGSVASCAVVPGRNRRGDRRLIAYLVAETGCKLAPSDLRAYLRRSLPEYMVPSVFVILDRLPLTANGKLDRDALPAPSEAESDAEDALDTPEDAILLEVTRVMGEVLAVPRVGRHDDFFELGGNSLAAIELVHRIERRLGAHITLEQIWIDSASPGAIAKAVRAQTVDQPPDPVVVLQAGVGQDPLFCLHTLGGDVFHYLPLVATLDSALPVLGIRAATSQSGDEAQFDVPSAVRHAAGAIRRTQPVGPYRLCGWSSGGLLALEVARALAPERCLVIMIDTYNSTLQRPPGLMRRLVAIARRVMDKVWDYPAAAVRAHGFVFLRRLWAYSGYTPQPTDQPFVLIRSSQSVDATGDPHLGWTGIARAGIDLEIVEGDHEAIMRDPGVRRTGERLQHHLTRFVARETCTGPQERDVG